MRSCSPLHPTPLTKGLRREMLAMMNLQSSSVDEVRRHILDFIRRADVDQLYGVFAHAQQDEFPPDIRKHIIGIVKELEAQKKRL